MAYYIKANPLVAAFLGLEKERNKVADGNYLLWQADMCAFGRLTELPEIMKRIGGLMLRAHEAREEQDGTVVRTLPEAEDGAFRARADEEDETAAEAGEAGTEETGDDEGKEAAV